MTKTIVEIIPHLTNAELAIETQWLEDFIEGKECNVPDEQQGLFSVFTKIREELPEFLKRAKMDIFDKISKELLEEIAEEVKAYIETNNPNIHLGGSDINSAIAGSGLDRIAHIHQLSITGTGDDPLGQKMRDDLDSYGFSDSLTDGSLVKGKRTLMALALQGKEKRAFVRTVVGKEGGVDINFDTQFSPESIAHVVDQVNDFDNNPNVSVHATYNLTLEGKVTDATGLSNLRENILKNPNIDTTVIVSSKKADVDNNRSEHLETLRSANRISSNMSEMANLLDVDKNDWEEIIKKVRSEIIEAEPTENKGAYNKKVENFGKPYAFITSKHLGAIYISKDDIFRVSIDGRIKENPKHFTESTIREEKMYAKADLEGKKCYMSGCGDTSVGIFHKAVKAGLNPRDAARLSMYGSQEVMKSPLPYPEDPKQLIADFFEKEYPNENIKDLSVESKITLLNHRRDGKEFVAREKPTAAAQEKLLDTMNERAFRSS